MRKESFMEELYNDLRQCLVDLNQSKAKELANQMVAKEMDYLRAVEFCGEGLREVGHRFENGEMFLPELVKSGEIMKKILSILEPEIKKSGHQKKIAGRVVIGTVEGDVHDIGKNIAVALFIAEGFEVYDLGKDVPASRFVQSAKDVQADIVGASALLSSTIIRQKDLVNAFISDGSRERFKILIGGAPVTPEWAESIGVDGFADNAVKGIRVAKSLIAGR
jgi:trimethylamine corrinoid protein